MRAAAGEKTRTEELKLLEFTVGPAGAGGAYGINLAKTVEVMARPETFAELPNAHPAIIGMVRARDENVPVVDLAEWMGGKADEAEKRRIILAEFSRLLIGFLVREATRIHSISWDMVEPPSGLIRESDFQYVTGVAKTPGGDLMLLDFERIVSKINPATGLRTRKAAPERERRGSATVFVAEDSPFIRDRMARILSGAGYRVFTAGDGREALERLQWVAREAETKNIDIRRYLNVVVTDVEMPRMDGQTLIKKIREIPLLQDIPIVIFSSMADEANERKWAGQGAAGLVAKPDVDKLVERMDELVFGAAPEAP
ncbi:MAG: chemotaxis protein CheV [Candidatus Nitrospinota bacterium M3_3B_026]